MIFATLKEEGYPLFTDPNTRDQYIGEMVYLEQLGAENDAQLEIWEISEFLIDDSDAEITFEADTEANDGDVLHAKKPRSRKELTKRFFEELKRRRPSKKPPDLKKLEAEEQSIINAVVERYHHSSLDGLRRAMRGKLASIAEDLRDIRSHQKDVVDYRLAIEAHEKGTAPKSTYSEHFEKIIANGFYRYHHHDKTRIFYTTEEVLIQEVKPKAKLDIRVNLGQFLVAQSLETSNIFVSCHKDNTVIGRNGIIHPHIRGASICWGSAANQSQKLIVTRDFSGVMALLQSLLQSYGTSPYGTIQQFHQAIARRQDGHYKLATGKTIERPPDAEEDNVPFEGTLISFTAATGVTATTNSGYLPYQAFDAPTASVRTNNGHFLRSANTDALWPTDQTQRAVLDIFERYGPADGFARLADLNLNERELDAVVTFMQAYAATNATGPMAPPDTVAWRRPSLDTPIDQIENHLTATVLERTRQQELDESLEQIEPDEAFIRELVNDAAIDDIDDLLPRPIEATNAP